MKNESLKMSKKDLKQLGYNLCGVYCGGNVYNYENNLHYLNSDRDKISNTDLKDYINSLKFDDIDDIKDKRIYFNSYQVAYSVGLYGNSGQLHKIIVWCDDEIVDIFFTYYC